jgi:hypothetical protein
MGVTKAAERRRTPAKALRAPRCAAGTHANAAQEWKAWHAGGWASTWSGPQLNEARELLWLISALHATDDARLRIRLTPLVRAGRRSLGLDKPSPLQPDDEAPAPHARRHDPRLDADA